MFLLHFQARELYIFFLLQTINLASGLLTHNATEIISVDGCWFGYDIIEDDRSCLFKHFLDKKSILYMSCIVRVTELLDMRKHTWVFKKNMILLNQKIKHTVLTQLAMKFCAHKKKKTELNLGYASLASIEQTKLP